VGRAGKRSAAFCEALKSRFVLRFSKLSDKVSKFDRLANRASHYIQKHLGAQTFRSGGSYPCEKTLLEAVTEILIAVKETVVSVSLVRQLIDELKADSSAQRELAERLALTISEDPNLRVLLLNALIAEAATKNDVESAKGELKQEIAAVRSELKQEIAAVRSELKQEIAAVRSELKQDVSEIRADMRTYFYGFMGGILATIVTVVLTRLL
jgi:hypothetical protein